MSDSRNFTGSYGPPMTGVTSMDLPTGQRLLASKIISRLEFRRDMSSENVFPYRSGAPNYSPMDSQNTVTLGLIYAFSSADAK